MFLKKVFWELPGEIYIQNPREILIENFIFSKVAGYDLKTLHFPKGLLIGACNLKITSL